MAKRLTDTDKWKKVWFRKLKPIYKVLWEYIRDNCNNAGIWDIDFDLASFMIGEEINIAEAEKALKKQFVKVGQTKTKWFLVDFVEWQYNCSLADLNPDNNAHLSVIRILNKYDIKGLIRVSKDSKDKDKDKDKDKKGGKKNKKIKYTTEQLETLWKAYPGKAEQKGSKKKALEYLNRATYKHTYEQTLDAVRAYANTSELVVKGIVFNLSTFLSESTDHIGQWINGDLVDTNNGDLLKKKKYSLICPKKCKNSTVDIVDDPKIYKQCSICGTPKVVKKTR